MLVALKVLLTGSLLNLTLHAPKKTNFQVAALPFSCARLRYTNTPNHGRECDSWYGPAGIMLHSPTKAEFNAVHSWFTHSELLRDGFGEEQYFKVMLVELTSAPVELDNLIPPSPESIPPSASMEKNEKLVGYAMYFFNYSACQGRVLFLEDLFIRAEYRSE